MTNDPFRGPPRRNWTALRVEDAACKRALKTAGVAPAAVYRASGLPPTGMLTFEVLVGYAEFPINPAVSAEPLDDVLTLMTKFGKSRLLRAWLETWEARPVRRGERAMVVRGAKTGFVIVYDSPVPPERPHLSLGFRHGIVLRVEPLASWCRGVGWAPPQS